MCNSGGLGLKAKDSYTHYVIMASVLSRSGLEELSYFMRRALAPYYVFELNVRSCMGSVLGACLAQNALAC